MTQRQTQTLGYPRIGKNREIKRALEGYWRGRVDEQTLMTTFWETAEQSWRDQLAAGVTHIAVGSDTLYDQMLDWTVRLGLIPERFEALDGLTRYFAMARGVSGIPALEMTKWFNTNYHYLVPELSASMKPKADFSDFVELVTRAQSILGERAVPVIFGPYTYLHLARIKGQAVKLLERILPLYRALLETLAGMGIKEVQIHEPALVFSGADEDRAWVEGTFEAFRESGVAINLVTYFEDLGETYTWVMDLPVDVISLDFTRGDNLALLKEHGFPRDRVLAAGVIDGRSVWRMRPDEVLALVAEVETAIPAATSLRLGTSSSLQFVPYTAAREGKLPEPLRNVLSFAEEKLAELTDLADGDVATASAAWDAFRAFSPPDAAVQSQVSALTETDFARSLPYEQRKQQQVKLPPLPTTTIGSFPQTREVRRLRARYRKGEITQEQYEAGVDAFTAYTIGVQDGLGLDMLVHGEFERTDMVEFFAQKMNGFAFTRFGWVQSFGSRYVRPPIIFGDVSRPAAMTTREFKVAQSYTDKPVKGMLTGPVTIINWSYPRTDIPRSEIAYQIALALRDEISDLEAAGCRAVQVDEPALREGLPLKEDLQQAYLKWGVDSFRLTTGKAVPATQVHTHMCYAEFGEILAAIDGMDADVISIENARSGDETLREIASYGYPAEVGPGVYDIHSPVVPTTDFIVGKIRSFVKHLKPEQIWVNPDCGLKTRRWEEVTPSLRNMMDAVRIVRAELVD